MHLCFHGWLCLHLIRQSIHVENQKVDEYSDVTSLPCVVQAINGHSLSIITNLMEWLVATYSRKKMNTTFQQVALLFFRKMPTLLGNSFFLNMLTNFLQVISGTEVSRGNSRFLKNLNVLNEKMMKLVSPPASNELFLLGLSSRSLACLLLLCGHFLLTISLLILF